LAFLLNTHHLKFVGKRAVKTPPMGAHKGLIKTPAADYTKAMMTGLDKYQAAVDRGDVGPSRIYISR
jgi:hypothetical protein